MNKKECKTPEIDRLYEQFLDGISAHGYSNYNNSPNYIEHIGFTVDNIPYVFTLMNYKDGRSKADWQILQIYSERENIPERYDYFSEIKFKHKWGVPEDLISEYIDEITVLIFDLFYKYLSKSNMKLKRDLDRFEKYCESKRKRVN